MIKSSPECSVHSDIEELKWHSAGVSGGVEVVEYSQAWWQVEGKTISRLATIRAKPASKGPKPNQITKSKM